MIVRAQSRDGKETLEFDPDLGAHHPETVVLNGKSKGHKFRKKHLDILGYLMVRKNEEVSYGQIAKEVWETTVGGPYGTIYKTTQQVATLIGNNWIKHKPNVSIEFCTLIRAEHPASDYLLVKESENVLIEVDGKRVASLWVPPFRRPLARSGANNELTLLLAKTAITDLVGRDDLWRECVAWCDDSSLGPVSVFCIQGRGGCGKTRFALELVHYLRSLEGWDARFVQFERSEAFDLWAKTAGPNHVLLVCDYASDHAAAIADSLRLLKHRPPGDATRRLRILLLARSASFRSGWLLPFESTSTLEHGQSPRDYFRPNNPIAELTPLCIEDRIRVFKQAHHAAASYLGLREQTLDEAAFQDDHIVDTLTDPLSLMLVALTGLRNGVSNALLLTKSELARETAKLFVEQRLRAALPENAALGLHMTAYATISSGLTLDAALEALMKESQALHLGSVVDSTAFLEKLAAWLPGHEDNQLGAVEPDILGEAFVLDQLCARGEGAKEIICRSVADHPAPAVRFIIRLVQDFSLDKSVSRSEPLQWLETIIERGYINDYGLLCKIIDLLHPSFVEDVPLVLTVLEKVDFQMRSMWCSNQIKPLQRFTFDLPALAIRIACARYLAGDDEHALLHVDGAVSTYRAGEEAHGEADLILYTQSLDYLAKLEGEAGLAEQALAHTKEVVELYRQLTERVCSFFVYDRGNTLLYLSSIESELNQKESALAHAQEAFRIFQKLSQDDLTEFHVERASSLSSLGLVQAKMGDTEIALINAREAVDILNEQAKKNRRRFLPYLAASLSCLALVQDLSGQQKEALASAEGAVACDRELLEYDRGRFLLDSVPRLSNLGVFERRLGNYARARTIAEELTIRIEQIAEWKGTRYLMHLDDVSETLEFMKRLPDSGQLEISVESAETPRRPVRKKGLSLSQKSG